MSLNLVLARFFYSLVHFNESPAWGTAHFQTVSTSSGCSACVGDGCYTKRLSFTWDGLYLEFTLARTRVVSLPPHVPRWKGSQARVFGGLPFQSTCCRIEFWVHSASPKTRSNSLRLFWGFYRPSWMQRE